MSVDQNTLIPVEIPSEYVQLASEWYDGSGSMLYAITSTGGLTLGSRRPLDCETDQEWQLRLFCCLSSELSSLRRMLKDKSLSDYLQIESFEDWTDATLEHLAATYGIEEY